MKKTFVLSGALFTLSAFIIGSIIGVLDIFGIFDKHPSLTFVQDSIPKISLLLIGLIGAVVLIQHWASIKSIEKDSKETATSVNDIAKTLSNVDQLTYPTRLLTDRDKHYLSFLQALDSAPVHSTVDVTHFEKLMGTPYDVGESDSEERCMVKWKERVLGGTLQVRQIIHISCLHDLGEVEARLAEYKDCLNYSLNVVYGPPIFPYIDLALIKGHWGCIDLSSDAVEPFYASTMLEITNATIIDSLAKYFEIWWSKFSIPLKTKGGIRWDELHRIKSLLPKTDRKITAEHFPELALVVTRKGSSVRNLAEAIVGIAERLHTPALSTAYKPDIDKAIETVMTDLKRVVQHPKQIDKDLVESVLIDTVKYANTRLRAVSYDVDQALFWNSPFGERLFKANLEATETIDIKRIFLLTNEQFTNNDVYALIKKQAKAGIEVYYAHADEVDVSLRHDFLIMDDNIVFEMSLSPDPDPEKSGTLFASAEALLAHSNIFDNLLLKSNLFNENQKKL